MGDTNSSGKKHSKIKRTPTAKPSVQENDVEATSQVRHCENLPKSKQKSLEEEVLNGPSPGMSSNSQDACHVAHIGHDADEAETYQLSRFQHLERMVKLIATHVGLGQDNDSICSDADDGSDPNWSPDDDQDHDDITGVVLEPRPPQKRRKIDDPLCSENADRIAESDGIFSALRTLSRTRSMLMIVSQNMQVTTCIQPSTMILTRPLRKVLRIQILISLSLQY